MASKTMNITETVLKALSPKKAEAKAEPKKAAAAAPKAEAKAEKKAAAAPKAEAKAEAKAEPKKAAAPESFALHLNKTGRLCIGSAAAERLGTLPFAVLKIEGKILRLIPSAKEIEGAIEVKYAHPTEMIRPYISATKAFKTLGFDGSEPREFEAKPYGATGFEWKW